MKNLIFFIENSSLFYKNVKEITFRGYYIIFSIILTFIACYIYIDQIIYLLTRHLLSNMSSNRLIFTTLTEVFNVYIKISFISSLLICLPFLLIHLWFYIIPGLYKIETYYFNFFFFIIFLFFALSFFINYSYILPNILKFFLYYENNSYYIPIHFEAKIHEYLIFIYKLLLNLILCFQIPPIIVLLLYFNIITYELLLDKRKYFYLFFLFLSALIAPPDVYSQFFLTLIMFSFFEILLFFLFFFRKLLFIS